MVCSEVYGILPCSEGVVGSIFLLLVYGFIVLQGARWISSGSELLLKVLDPGLIGGLLLPIVGALPDTFIVAASGLGGSSEEAQDKVEIGLGALAGANVMLLTLVIGVAIIVGRCDLDSQGAAIDKRLTRGWSVTKTGVTVDGLIKEGAIFMVISAMLLLVPQLPAYWGARRQDTVTLIGMIFCFVMLAAYFAWQTIAPTLQKRRMRAARHKLLKLYAVKTAHRLGGGFLNGRGEVDDDSLHKIFRQFDHGGDGHLVGSELKALVTGMTFGATGFVTKDYDEDFWLEHFTQDPESRAISEADFVKGMKQWINQNRDIHKRARSMTVLLRQVTRDSGHPTLSPRIGQQPVESSGAITEEQMSSHMAAREAIDRALQAATVLSEDDNGSSSSDSDSDEEESPPRRMPSKRSIATKGALYLLAGCAVIGVASDPLVSSLDSFSKASGVPQFFVSFVVAPLASNAQESVSSFLVATKRRKSHITLALAQVYGSVTLNNSMALGVFLAIVHFRKLRWTFDSEVTVILAVCIGVGLLGIRRTNYPLWTAYVLLSVYPLAIALTAILDYGVGWGTL